MVIRILLNPKSVDMEGVTTLAQAQAANEQLKQGIEERNKQAIAAWEARTGLKYDPEWKERTVRPDGPFRESTGSYIREGTIRNGEWNGEVREYKDGVLRKISNYKNGWESLARKLYREDGTLALDRSLNEDGNIVDVHYGEDGKTEDYRLVLDRHRKVLFDSRQQAEEKQEAPAEPAAQPEPEQKPSEKTKAFERVREPIGSQGGYMEGTKENGHWVGEVRLFNTGKDKLPAMIEHYDSSGRLEIRETMHSTDRSKVYLRTAFYADGSSIQAMFAPNGDRVRSVSIDVNGRETILYSRQLERFRQNLEEAKGSKHFPKEAIDWELLTSDNEGLRIAEDVLFYVKDLDRQDAEPNLYKKQRESERRRAQAKLREAKKKALAKQEELQKRRGQAGNTAMSVGERTWRRMEEASFAAVRPAEVGRQRRAGAYYPDIGQWLANTAFSIGERRKAEYRAVIASKRPDLPADEVERFMVELDKLGDTKQEKTALHWFVKGGLQLPEDGEKFASALKVAPKFKLDPFAFASPDELLAEADRRNPKKQVLPYIDPDTVPELTNKQDLGHGVVVYDVEDSPRGQAAMRRIINSHLGREANGSWKSPWCLLSATDAGEVSTSARKYWRQYNKSGRGAAFQDGRLIAFQSSDRDEGPEWWDLQDDSHGKDIQIETRLNAEEAVVTVWAKDYHLVDENGAPLTGEVVGVADLRPDGTLTANYPIKDVWFYRGNKENGAFETWGHYGRPIAREHYKYGVLDGVSYRFGTEFVTEEHWKNGKRVGVWEVRSVRDGSLLSRRTYTGNGQEEFYENYWENGNLRKKEHTDSGGLKDGAFEEFYEDGSILKREGWSHGHPHGVRASYHKNGDLSDFAEFYDGRPVSPALEFFNDGPLRKAYFAFPDVGIFRVSYSGVNNPEDPAEEAKMVEAVNVLRSRFGLPKIDGVDDFFKDTQTNGGKFTYAPAPGNTALSVGEKADTRRPKEGIKDEYVGDDVVRAMRVLANGEDAVLERGDIGEIVYPIGKFGKHGFGFLHIVEQRMKKNGESLEDAIYTALRVGEAVVRGRPYERQRNRYRFSKDGTSAVVAFDADGRLTITGYDEWREKKTSAEGQDDALKPSSSRTPNPQVRKEEAVAALANIIANRLGNGSANTALSVGSRPGRAPVVEPGGDVREAGEGAWLRRKFVHSQTPVFYAVRRVMCVGLEPPDALNVEAVAKNVHGKIRARQEMLQRAYLEPLKAILAQPGVDRKRFDDYALALHALERNRMIQERSVVVDPTTGEVVDLGVEAGSGVTNAWAERVIREIQRDPFAAQYKEAANILAEMNRFVLRGAVADGLLTEAQAATWMRLSPHYVPLKSGGAAPGAIHKRATGRFTRPDSVLVNSMRQAYATVRNGELNRVNKTMADWIREYDPNGEKLGATVPESHKHAKIKMTEPQYVPKGSSAEALLRERGIRLVETEDKGGYWVDTGVLPNALKRVVRESVPQGDDIVTFWENGERKFIRFEGKRGRDGTAENDAARIADALNFKNVLHKEGRFWDAIRGLTRWKANVSTSWNPTFIVRNMGADVFNTANLMMIEGKYAELARTMRNYPAALRTIARLHSLRREAGDSKMERMFARCFCAVFCW